MIPTLLLFNLFFFTIFRINNLLLYNNQFLILNATISLTYLVLVHQIIKSIKFTLIPIILTSLVCFTLLLITPTTISKDFYRYLWDGWLTRTGINPYLVSPGDKVLVNYQKSKLFPYLEKDFYDEKSLYPPFAQIIFLFSHLIFSYTGFIGAKLVLASSYFFLLYLAYRTLSPKLFAIFALNPLILFELANGAHIDGWLTVFLYLAIVLFLKQRYLISSLFLSLSIVTKIYPIIFLPLLVLELIKNRQLKIAVKFITISIITGAIFYSFFISRSIYPLIRYLDGFKYYQYNSLFFDHLQRYFVHRLPNPVLATSIISSTIFIVISIVLAIRKFKLINVLYLGIAYLLLSPLVYPWYVIFLIPLIFLQVDSSANYYPIYALAIFQFFLNTTYVDNIQGIKWETAIIITNRVEYFVLFILLAIGIIQKWHSPKLKLSNLKFMAKEWLH